MDRREHSRSLIEQTLPILDELAVVQDELSHDPDQVADRAFPPVMRPRALVGARAGADAAKAGEFARLEQSERRRLLQIGASALERIRSDGAAVRLLPDEELGLEVILRFVARPAVLFHEGRFVDPPPPWETLTQFRDSIDTTARSVGRIELPHVSTVPYAGTGFLVADDVLMTNCHVAQLFANQQDTGGWVFSPASDAGVDHADDPDGRSDGTAAARLDIDDLIGMHDRLDLALLRVRHTGGPMPTPLTLMSTPPDGIENRTLYVVGYPAFDRRNDQLLQSTIFGDTFSVKRLQPGKFVVPPPGPVIRISPFSSGHRDADVFAHDASTLGGNSGSCVVDLETDLVVGLHYSGLYTRYNQAIALWTLVDDPLLLRAGVQFD